MPTKLRVAIDCRIRDSQQGVGTAVLTLAKALSDSATTEQEYTFIVSEKLRGWLSPYVYGPCRLEGVADSKLMFMKSLLRPIAPLRWLWKKARAGSETVPVSDGYVDSGPFDVVHFPTQVAYLTTLPSIYQPWDLQHLHYPQYFTSAEYASREKQYRAFCEQAAKVCVQAEWTKKDLIEHYSIAADKVVVIPWCSVFDAYETPTGEDIQGAVAKYNLPEAFFIYPAVTWPHKNHEVIFRALHILKKDYALTPQVYFTGASTKNRIQLDCLARELGVAEQVHFLGFLTPLELQSLYRVATAMLFPSKFEGFGLPILEAFHSRLAVICARVTTLPEVAREGALYFDPDDPTELALRMRSILETPALRQELVEKGTLALSQYTIAELANNFQVLYEGTAALRTSISPPSPSPAKGI